MNAGRGTFHHDVHGVGSCIFLEVEVTGNAETTAQAGRQTFDAGRLQTAGCG